MATRKGNKLWQLRQSHGRNPKFETPDDLWQVCVDYFEYCDSNPLYERKYFNVSGKLVHRDIPRPRAMTLKALCTYIGITFETWCQWRKPEHYLSDIIKDVENIIFAQKFEGAAAGLLKENIIARELGLADTTKNIEDNPNDMTPWSEVTAATDE